jgi:hypothetical protein
MASDIMSKDPGTIPDVEIADGKVVSCKEQAQVEAGPKFVLKTPGLTDPKIIALELLNTRRRQAWELKKQGWTYQKIGEKLGISLSQASVDVSGYAARLADEEFADTLRHRILDADRLEDMIGVLWDRVMAGDFAAMDMVLKIQTRKAKLLGMDSPTKFEHKVAHESRPKKGVNQEELDKRLMELYERMKARGVPISPLFQRWADEKESEGREIQKVE